MCTRKLTHTAASRLILGLPLLASTALGVLLPSCSCSSGDPVVPSTDETEDATPELPYLAFVKFDKGLPVGGTWRGYPSLVDFTGDGRADIIVSNREEDGWNAWTSTSLEGGWERRIEGMPRDMLYGGQDAGDLNGDGHPDLVLVSHTKGLTVFLNDGQMNWTNPNEGRLDPSAMMLDVVLANLDGDEHLDAFGISHFKGGLKLYLGKGDGKFEFVQNSGDLIGVERAFGMQVEVADLDGDGDDDLIAGTDKGVKVFITERIEGALSWNEISEGLPVPSIGNTVRGLAPGDFNGDGKIDLAWCGLKDPLDAVGEGNHIGVYEWHAESSKWLQFDSGLDSDNAHMDLKAADFNKDGFLDLAAVETATGLTIYLGDGKGGFEKKGLVKDVYGKSKIEVGDVDGDGWTDILVSLQVQKNNRAAGGIWTLLNSPDIWK